MDEPLPVEMSSNGRKLLCRTCRKPLAKKLHEPPAPGRDKRRTGWELSEGFIRNERGEYFIPRKGLKLWKSQSDREKMDRYYRHDGDASPELEQQVDHIARQRGLLDDDAKPGTYATGIAPVRLFPGDGNKIILCPFTGCKRRCIICLGTNK
jgi:hypothetical protein